MSVIQSIQNIASAVRIRPAGNVAGSQAPAAKIDADTRIDLVRARTSLLQLYSSLEELAEQTNVSSRFRAVLPDAESSPGLSLNLVETAATLASVEEINASPTSFTPFGPAWDGSSSALLTIGGEYDGSAGSGNLSFEVRRAGTHGEDNLRIRVRDTDNSIIRNFNIRRNDAPDQQYDLQNGLYFTLGAGSVTNRDTSSAQVFDAIGSVVDPNMPLGGVRNNNPNLQFGSPAIVDGSFMLNNTAIAVNTTDSINDVIDRINQSSAGTTATFNSATERIEFLQDTTGSLPTIDLQSDTSNFLEATKLDTASVVPGTDDESTVVFANVAEFSSVQSGNIIINGEQIAIDSGSDSLTTVIDKINASSAGVVATFDTGSQRLRLQAAESTQNFEIDDNGTGFFAAVNIVDGRIEPDSVSRGLSRRRSYEVADTFSDIFSELNFLFRDNSFRGKGENAGIFRGSLESAVGAILGSDSKGTAFGLEIDKSASARRRGDFAVIDRQAFTTSLQQRGDDVLSFLSDDESGAGLLDNLFRRTLAAIRNVNSSLGQSGFFIDTRV